MPDGRRIFAATNFTATTANIIWVDDKVPTGGEASSDGGDSWTWVTGSPSPASGSMAHQSAIVSGVHQHFFKNATATMTVDTGTVLYAYIYLDPANPPTEAMLQWYDGSSWEHRAYWGANALTYGTDGTASRRNIGALPAAGQWVQLKVPASQVGLEGKTLTGMAFTLNGGRATWDAAGLLNPAITNTPGSTNTPPGGDTGSTNTNSSLPSVSITAKDGSVVGANPGVFTFTRTGSTTSALSVVYSLAGTATSGVDYQLPQAIPATGEIVAIPSVIIPAGATSATLTIMPNSMTNITDSKTVIANVASSSSYSVIAPGNASLTMAGNTVAKPTLKMNASGPTLSWASTNGAAYRIAFKNQLSDPAWTYMTNTVDSSGNATSWTDTEKLPQRFYLIIQTQ